MLQGHVLLAITPKSYKMQDCEHMFKGLSSQVSVTMYWLGTPHEALHGFKNRGEAEVSKP